MFGFSLITLIFADEIDSAIARQRVLERLNYLGRKLPPGVEPTLGPDATGLGWVYQYYLDAKSGYDLGESRSLQDWFIRYDGSVRFTTAPSASTQCAQRLSAVGRNVYRGHRIFFSCAHDRKQAL